MSEIKKDIVYLEYILNCVNQILIYTANLDEKNFSENQLIKDAVVRNFEIIGEASKRISNDLKEISKNIEWKKMAGLRDKLIYNYIEIDYEIIWYTIENFIPQLKNNIEILMETEKSQ